MMIDINDDECWICGSKVKLTKHHCLPKHLKPNKNIIVPICEKCHKKINADDVAGLYSYVFKLYQQVNQLTKQVTFVKTAIENKAILELISSRKNENKLLHTKR